MFRAKRVFFLTAITAVVLSRSAFAQAAEREHARTTPHGGVVQKDEDMQVEFLIDRNGEPRVYFQDGAMKALQRSDIQVKLTVAGHDGIQHERDLRFVKDPKDGPLFKGEPIKGMDHWHGAVVSIKTKDQWSPIPFSNH